MGKGYDPESVENGFEFEYNGFKRWIGSRIEEMDNGDLDQLFAKTNANDWMHLSDESSAIYIIEGRIVGSCDFKTDNKSWLYSISPF